MASVPEFIVRFSPVLELAVELVVADNNDLRQAFDLFEFPQGPVDEGFSRYIQQRFGGVFGNGGQTDYSAANDFLCKSISNFRTTRPQTRGIAIDWTAWGGIGMAARGSIPAIMGLFQKTFFQALMILIANAVFSVCVTKFVLYILPKILGAE